MLVREFIRCLKKILVIYLLSVFGCAGSWLLCGFSLVAASWGYSRCGAQASHCRASLVANHRL